MATSTQELLNTLRRVPLFNELSETELSALAMKLVVHRYDAWQILFSEGDRGGDLLIVKEGSVKVVKTAANGLISIERPGSSLGEVSIFDEGVYSTTAIASTPVVMLRLHEDRPEKWAHFAQLNADWFANREAATAAKAGSTIDTERPLFVAFLSDILVPTQTG